MLLLANSLVEKNKKKQQENEHEMRARPDKGIERARACSSCNGNHFSSLCTSDYPADKQRKFAAIVTSTT